MRTRFDAAHTGSFNLDLSAEPVAVIIPCYNAEPTLDETLRSVRSQTYQALDIVVVDDGSDDRTAEIAEAHAAVDPRIRIVRQPNLGVAAARNLGIAHTNTRYIAPIDADDLWAATKIERQMRIVAEYEGELGVVYSWFYVIDEEGKIRFREYRSSAEGFVLEHICRRNLVGCGSNALILRKAVDENGGYSTSLRKRGVQGGEDYLLCLKIAEKYEFAVVKEYLTGYRERRGSMSSDVHQMVQSHAFCMADFSERHPHLKSAALEGRARFLRFMVARCWREGAYGSGAKLIFEMLETGFLRTLFIIAELVSDRWHRSIQLRSEGPHPSFFEIGDVGDAPGKTVVDVGIRAHDLS